MSISSPPSVANGIYSFYAYSYLQPVSLRQRELQTLPVVGVSANTRVVDGDFTQARFVGIAGLVANPRTNVLFAADRASVIRKIDVGATTVDVPQ